MTDVDTFVEIMSHNLDALTELHIRYRTCAKSLSNLRSRQHTVEPYEFVSDTDADIRTMPDPVRNCTCGLVGSRGTSPVKALRSWGNLGGWSGGAFLFDTDQAPISAVRISINGMGNAHVSWACSAPRRA